MATTTSVRMRFEITDGKCAIAYRFASDTDWHAFGDPVPVLSGALAGFEVHDVYHLTLLAETGWSAVLGILLAGDRGGVFGGPGALAEEAVVMDWFLTSQNTPAKSMTLLNAVGAGVKSDALARARDRGAKAVKAAMKTLGMIGRATLRIDDIPTAFEAKVRAHRG